MSGVRDDQFQFLFPTAERRVGHEHPALQPVDGGQSEEIAGTAVYVASRASDFMAGATIRVDGGYSIR